MGAVRVKSKHCIDCSQLISTRSTRCRSCVSKGRLCTQEFKDYMSQKMARRAGNQTAFQKGHAVSQEVREKISRANRGREQSQEEKDKRSASAIGHPVSEETRTKLSQVFRGRVFSEEWKQRMSESQKGKLGHHNRPHTKETKRQIQNISYALWQDPAYVLKQMQARGIKPNKPEQSLETILSKHCPQFKYNGDGRLGIVLAGLVPDFVNINGKKQVIEVFGTYWHQRNNLKWHQTELGRVMAYNSIGWNCLVIWESELKDIELVKNKLLAFDRET